MTRLLTTLTAASVIGAGLNLAAAASDTENALGALTSATAAIVAWYARSVWVRVFG